MSNEPPTGSGRSQDRPDWDADAADACVHTLDHGGVGGHADVPCGFVGDFAPWRHFWRARAEFVFLVDDAHGLHALMALVADGFPAICVAPAVAFDIGGGGLDGEMRRGVGEV